MSLYEMHELLVAAPAGRQRRCTRLGAYNVLTHSHVFMYGISAIILLNVAFAAFMTDDDEDGTPDDPTFATFYTIFEAASTAIFTAEYFLRLWACVETPGGVESFWPQWLVGECAKQSPHGTDDLQSGCAELSMMRLRWATNPTAIFDAMVCGAFWVDLVLEYWATEQMKGVSSTLRMFRIFQFAITILRLETQSPAFRRMAKVLTSSASELLLCFFLAGVLMVLGAVLIFFVEYQQVLGHGDNNQFGECGPDEGLMRARFKSLSRCIYWAAMTITTVGYGDMHPCTPTGQMIAVVWGFFGVAVVALPSGIIGSGLVDVMAEAKEKRAEAKKQSQLRQSQLRAKAATSAGGISAPPTAEDMRNPARFYDLGLAMLLPPGTVASSSPLSSATPGSPHTRSRAQTTGSMLSDTGANVVGPGTSEAGLMKRLEHAEAVGKVANSPRRGRNLADSGSDPSNQGPDQIAAQLLDDCGQLNLNSESAIRGCAALLFPGDFVFDPSAEQAAERGVRLAQALGATTATDIAGVQQILVRKLAREYLKARFREGFAADQMVAQAPEQASFGNGGGDRREAVVSGLPGSIGPMRSQTRQLAPTSTALFIGSD